MNSFIVTPNSLLLLIFSLFLNADFASAAVVQNPKVLFKLGNEAIVKQDFKKAISYYEDAIKVGLSGDELAQAYRILGSFYLGSDKVSDIEKGLHYHLLENPEEQDGCAVLRLDLQTEDKKNAREDTYDCDISHGKSTGSGNRYVAFGGRQMGALHDHLWLRGGEYHIDFMKFGYETETLDFSVTPRKSVILTNTVVFKKNKTPIEYVAAKGNIVEAKSGAPLTNVEVTFFLEKSTFRLETKTDSQGHFASSELPKGKYGVLFSHRTHIANEMPVDLVLPNTDIATVTMDNTKQITIRYSVTETNRPSVFNPQSTNIVALKISGIGNELGSGFNFIERKIAGSYYGPDSRPSVMFTQGGNMLTINCGMETGLFKLGKVSWDSVRDGTMYRYSEPQRGSSSCDVGDVFVFSIMDGKQYAKLQILEIEDRKDVP